MADRAVYRTRKDQDGDILALCNGAELWSPRLNADAITDIETGAHRYYVPWADGKSTWIRVVNGPAGKYLRTDKDNTPRNNLHDLPNC
jgi:hypothetical protein